MGFSDRSKMSDRIIWTAVLLAFSITSIVKTMPVQKGTVVTKSLGFEVGK